MTAALTDNVVRGEEPQVVKADPDDERFHSVTSALQVLHKEGIVYWACEQTAKKAVQLAQSLATRIEEEGEPVIVKQLRDARFAKRDLERDGLSDTQFGIELHSLAEEYALTGTKPTLDTTVFGADIALAQACLDSFDRWLQEFTPQYHATEMTVFSPTYGVAGTLDAIMTIDGFKAVVDYKGSKKSWDGQGKPSPVYPETALQIAAYRHAELAAVWRPRVIERYRKRYYVLGATEKEQAVPVPGTDGGIAIKITPEHTTAYPVRCDDEVYEAFLFVLEVARFERDIAKDAIGPALAPPKRD
jgi:hypothetical protein